jgi:hypothetical protein
MGMLLSSYKGRELCQFTLSLSSLHSVYMMTVASETTFYPWML